MIKDIDYYLKNIKKREDIANSGKKNVFNSYLFENTLINLFK